MKDLVADYLRQGLGLKVSEPEVSYVSSNVIIGPDGLPTFRSEGEGPVTLTIDELLALEQEILLEEDLARVGLAPR